MGAELGVSAETHLILNGRLQNLKDVVVVGRSCISNSDVTTAERQFPSRTAELVRAPVSGTTDRGHTSDGPKSSIVRIVLTRRGLRRVGRGSRGVGGLVAASGVRLRRVLLLIGGLREALGVLRLRHARSVLRRRE